MKRAVVQKIRFSLIAMLAIVFAPVFSSIPASYDRLFREQENHIQSLEEQMTALSFELERERSQSAQLKGMSEKYTGLSSSYDKLKLVKVKLQKELEKNRGQLKDLKKYYVLEQKESDLREKRMLKASTKLAQTLNQREKQIDYLERDMLKATNELKAVQVKYTKLSREYQGKEQLVADERASYKGKFERLRKELVDAHHSASIKGQELEQALHKNTELLQSVDEMKQLLITNRDEAQKTFDVRINALQKKLVAASNLAKSEEIRRIDVESKLASVEQTAKATDSLLQASLKDKRVLEENCSSLKTAMAQHIEKYTEVSAELKTAKLLLDAAVKDKVFFEENWNNLKSSMSASIEKHQKTTSDLEQATSLLESVTAEAARLRDKNALLQDQTNDIVRENKVLLSRKQSFDEALKDKDSDYTSLLSVKQDLEKRVSRLQAALDDSVSERKNLEETGFSATKVADLTEQLDYANTSIEKLRQMLSREKKFHSKRVAGYHEQLAQLSGELNQVRIEYAQLNQNRAVKGQEDWQALRDLQNKYNRVMAELSQAQDESSKSRAMNSRLFAQIEEKERVIGMLKNKTTQLLGSLGLGSGKDRHSQKTSYLRKLAQRELAELSMKELEQDSIAFSSGLKSLLSDSRLIGSMIDEFGRKAAYGTSEGIRQCEELHKVFLARKQMVAGDVRAEDELDQMFKTYAKFASKQLGDSTIASLSIADLSKSGNSFTRQIKQHLSVSLTST